MQARDFLDVLRRRWLAVVAVVVIFTGAVAALEYHATPQYRADAKEYFAIKTSTTGTGNDLSQGSAYVQGQVLTYATLATTPTVLAPVIAELKLKLTPSQLAGQISATVLPNTVVVTVEATSSSPRLAASLANSVAQQLGVAVAALAPVDATGASRIVSRTIATAPVPKVPATPKKKRNISAAFVGSLLLGVAFAMLLELLATQRRRDRLPSPDRCALAWRGVLATRRRGTVLCESRIGPLSGRCGIRPTARELGLRAGRPASQTRHRGGHDCRRTTSPQPPCD